MANRALIAGAGTIIDGLIMDVGPQPVGVVGRTHRLQTRFGGEQLEDGRVAIDIAEAEPKVLRLECIASDFLGAASVAQVQQQLETMQASTATFRVNTEWGVYPEMALASADAATLGRGMRLTLEVREIQRVSQAQAGGVPVAARAGEAVNRGSQVDRGLVHLPAVPHIGPVIPSVVDQVVGGLGSPGLLPLTGDSLPG